MGQEEDVGSVNSYRCIRCCQKSMITCEVGMIASWSTCTDIRGHVCMRLGVGRQVAWDVQMMGQEEDVGSVNS